ncbi:MAG: PQQ-binding-like beta-propeller repeat protein [bacterium]|nr:PQQ-binding-like beta-propeller repeat protein [bacterium]
MKHFLKHTFLFRLKSVLVSLSVVMLLVLMTGGSPGQFDMMQASPVTLELTERFCGGGTGYLERTPKAGAGKEVISKQSLEKSTKNHPVVFETESVGVILKDKTAIWTKPGVPGSRKISEAGLGDVFFIRAPEFMKPGVYSECKWCKVSISPGKFGWVARDNIGCQPAATVNGYVEKDEYDYHPSIAGGKAVGGKSKWDDFYVQKYAVLEDGKNLKSCYYVHYYKSSSREDGEGWVIGQPVEFTYEGLYWSAGLHLGRWHQEMDWGSEYESLDAAERFFQLLLEKYPGKRFKASHWKNYRHNYHTYRSEVTALEYMAQISIKRKDYSGAVQRLEEIRKKFPGINSGIGNSAGAALIQMATIYAEHMKDPRKAIETLLQVIRQYPGSEIGGFEWNSTLDIRALGEIVDIGKKHSMDSKYMLMQFQKVSRISGFNVVRVLAAIENAKLLRKEKRYREAIAVLEKAIAKDPSSPMRFWGGGQDFSSKALLLQGTILIEDLKAPAQALKLYKKSREKYKNDYIAKRALFLTAEALDRATGTPGEVINAYTLSGDHKAKQRIQAIRSFKSKKGFLIAPTGKRIPLLEIAVPDAAVIKHLDGGDSVLTLYTGEHRDRMWYKVKTADGAIGWLEEKRVSFPALRQVSVSAGNSSWRIFGADRARTRAVKGRPVESPALIASFHNFAGHEILYWDANKDSIPDVVTTGYIDKPAHISQNSMYHHKAAVVLDGKTGSISMKIPTSDPLEPGTIHKGILYCGSQKGAVYAFDLAAGTIKWKFKTGCEPTVPVIEKDTAFLGNCHGMLYALDTNSGKLKWKKRVNGNIYSPPIIKDNKIYLAVSGYREQSGNFRGRGKGIVMCMDRVSGNILWKYETRFHTNTKPLSAAGNILLCPGNDNNLYALDMATGSLKWKYYAYNLHRSVPAVKDGIIYIGTGKGVFAMAAETGKIVWEHVPAKPVSFETYPCIVGDVLYTASKKGDLYMFRLSDGKIMWKFKLGVQVAAISSCGVEIAVVSTTNFLYIIGEKAADGEK